MVQYTTTAQLTHAYVNVAHVLTIDNCIVNLGEITDDMKTIRISQRKDVEYKRLHIIIERFVVKEQFGEKTQVLAVDLRRVPIDFKYRPIVLTIDFAAGRMQQCTPSLRQHKMFACLTVIILFLFYLSKKARMFLKNREHRRIAMRLRSQGNTLTTSGLLK